MSKITKEDDRQYGWQDNNNNLLRRQHLPK